MDSDLVFFIDVDNTLLENDAVMEDYRRHLVETFGVERSTRYWDIFEELSGKVGYADYLGALQKYRVERPRDLRVLDASRFLLRYPFAERLYPGALDAIAALQQRAPVVIVSDGDVVFQPNKVHRSGLWRAVDGNVLIYIHKEQMLDDMEHRYPARRYVMVEDKIRILAAVKAGWGERVTTVFVRQGHYATDLAVVSAHPSPDLAIDSIAELPQAVAHVVR